MVNRLSKKCRRDQKTKMILRQLKDTTSLQHRRLESRLDLLNRFSTVAEYKQLLTRFLGFYAAIEPPVAAALSGTKHDFDFAMRRKTPFLKLDLLALGLSQQEMDQVLLCQHLPHIDTPAQAFGYLYVAEGSTLGGQILARHFAQTLGINKTNGAAFFYAYGDDTGKMWRGFQTAINDFAATDQSHHVITAAAIETFEALDAWLFE